MTKLKNLIKFGFLELKSHSPSPHADVRLLLEYILGVQNLPILNPELEIKEEDFSLFKSFLERRKNGEPIAYITKNREFFGLNFEVSPFCLIPRADSEILVEEAIKIAKNHCQINTIIDLCTGSGCLIVSVLHSLKSLTGIGVDISNEALKIAEKNAKNLLPSKSAGFKICNILQEDLPFVNKNSIVISNPPYIKAGDIPFLEKGVKDFEPKLALDGGDDGLIFYQQIAKKCKKASFILLEIGMGMKEDICSIFEKEGYVLTSSAFDLGGIERVLIFQYL